VLKAYDANVKVMEMDLYLNHQVFDWIKNYSKFISQVLKSFLYRQYHGVGKAQMIIFMLFCIKHLIALQ